MHKMDDHESSGSTAFGHEPIETDVRAVWRTGAALAAAVLATFVLIVGMMKWLERAEGARAAGNEAKTDLNWPNQNPLQQLRAEERKMLDSYGWVDREGAVARIPVNRAIEIISEHGLPAALHGPTPAESIGTEPSTSAGDSPDGR
jgi:hypothetical protein